MHIPRPIVALGPALLVLPLTLQDVSRTPETPPTDRHGEVEAIVAAALCFVAHPLQTQSVSYVVQRMTSLSTFFYLGGVLLYVRGRLARSAPPDPTWLRGACFALAGVSWLFAMGSKQIAAPFQWKFTRADLNQLLAKAAAPQPTSLAA